MERKDNIIVASVSCIYGIGSVDAYSSMSFTLEKNNDSLAIMAVDNLPSELPRDSSAEFGDGIVNEVLPFMIEKDDGRILNATITHNGQFSSKYQYLSDYINS